VLIEIANSDPADISAVHEEEDRKIMDEASLVLLRPANQQGVEDRVMTEREKIEALAARFRNLTGTWHWGHVRASPRITLDERDLIVRGLETLADGEKAKDNG
jgi:hypothetical protein